MTEKIKIPKHFKRHLLLRFTPWGDKDRCIATHCLLCVEYNRECEGCPFANKSCITSIVGCFNKLNTVISNDERVFEILAGYPIVWCGADRQEALQQLAVVRQALEEQVEWIE